MFNAQLNMVKIPNFMLHIQKRLVVMVYDFDSSTPKVELSWSMHSRAAWSTKGVLGQLGHEGEGKGGVEGEEFVTWQVWG